MTREALEVMKAARQGTRDVSLDELLSARYQAQYAVRAYANLDREHAEIKASRELFTELSKAFNALCTALYDDAFCRLKAKHPAWPDVVVNGVRDGRAMIGMTERQARAAWGEPARSEAGPTNRTLCYDQKCRRKIVVMGKTVVEVTP